MNDTYPKYLMFFRETNVKEYVDIYTAASRQNSLFYPWEVLNTVLEKNGTVRNITREEIQKINMIADEMDANR